MNSIEKTLEYHELLMSMNDIDKYIKDVSLPKGYTFTFYNGEEDILEWAKIHLSSGEFTSYNRAVNYFEIFFKEFEDELHKRCFFIEYNKEKIATATISPTSENGYTCLIDWLAIKKDHQGKGLSKALIYKCLEVARNLGNTSILLHTQTHTWLAAKLYLDVGFTPYNIEENIKGWQILKTITNHKSLEIVESISENEMYDKLAITITSELNKLYGDYNYEIWYTNGANDVYVNNEGKFYHYKFFDDGKRLELKAWGDIYDL
ncbi:MAG: GNAT family N-acetyltransferase [Bacilli bacterium]|nr:GNAT family N-acetyltransferase [Bacilli bacterium]